MRDKASSGRLTALKQRIGIVLWVTADAQIAAADPGKPDIRAQCRVS
jgi:hypothetical protein